MKKDYDDDFDDDDEFENEEEERRLKRLHEHLFDAVHLITHECLPSFERADEAYDAVDLAWRIIQDEILGDDEDEVTE